jgi:hypothetical protein
LPFQNHHARSFKAAEIRREAPACSGVYGLSNARGWIHVGETDNIQGRLLEHLEGTDGFQTEGAPTGFSFELSPPQDRAARQSRLVLELHPGRQRGMGRRPEGAPRGYSSSIRKDSR